MAASKAQKEQAAQMLAAGSTETETATVVGVGRSTIQGWKRRKDFQSLIENYRAPVRIAKIKQAQTQTVSNSIVLEGLAALKGDEADLTVRIWALFSKIEEKTLALLETTNVEDLSPRQIPAMLKACTDIGQMGLTLNDRITGMGELLDGYQRIEQARAKGR